ncbi:hypothetical protein [Streptomyces sp. V1I1]|uniref:hypothetical protein n=1 Tax=Streptomyces sp. V1I1 TaxID=3042272 RepID=UPI00278A195F|nr:hypothetical protein [Streptomyces sp. V1I1]MDQ0942403.1 hypothetical protein [Streptomyces sp. V1I1]
MGGVHQVRSPCRRSRDHRHRHRHRHPVPLTAAAYATPVGSGKPLTIELGAPAPGGPLTRGGASETFSFTVKNSADKPVDFQP